MNSVMSGSNINPVLMGYGGGRTHHPHPRPRRQDASPTQLKIDIIRSIRQINDVDKLQRIKALI